MPEEAEAGLRWLRDEPKLRGPLLIAVSGGGDSMALARMVAADLEYFQGRVTAAVVDHALRDGSALDAAQAATWVRAMGIPTTILTRSGPRPTSRLQETARTSRLELLAREAHRVGARAIVLAHTLEDQAETVAFRIARGSGPLGLAGLLPLSPSPAWPSGAGILHARPFLTVRREALRVYLRNEGVDWLEDPANGNPRFARVRIRRVLTSADTSEPVQARFAAIAEAARALLLRRNDLCRHLADVAVEWTDTSAATISHQALAGAPRAVAAPLLGNLAAAIGGSPRAPSDIKTHRLLEGLVGGKSATLAGARFLRQATAIRVQPMPARAGIDRPLDTGAARQRFAGLQGDIEGWHAAT